MQEMSYQRHNLPGRRQAHLAPGGLADRHGHVQDLGRALGVFGDVAEVRLEAHQALGHGLQDVALGLPEEQAMGHEVVCRHVRHLLQDFAFIGMLQGPGRPLAFLAHRQLVSLAILTAQYGAYLAAKPGDVAPCAGPGGWLGLGRAAEHRLGILKAVVAEGLVVGIQHLRNGEYIVDLAARLDLGAREQARARADVGGADFERHVRLETVEVVLAKVGVGVQKVARRRRKVVIVGEGFERGLVGRLGPSFCHLGGSQSEG